MASAPITAFTAEPLAADVQRALARLARRNDVVAIAVMPDVHLAREVCIGTVVATANALMPEAVGGDIGCGMAAVRLDAAPDALADRAVADAVLTGLAEAIPTARHRTADAALPADLAETALSAPVLEAKKARIGRVQLGSLGRGNHFVEVQRCEAGALWLMLHSGSRGMGQAIRDHHSRGGPIAADSLAGAAYLADLDWALTYAAHSRRRRCPNGPRRPRRLDHVRGLSPQLRPPRALPGRRPVGTPQGRDLRARRRAWHHPRLHGQRELPRHRARVHRCIAVELPRRRSRAQSHGRAPRGQCGCPRTAHARGVVRSPHREPASGRGAPGVQGHRCRDARPAQAHAHRAEARASARVQGDVGEVSRRITCWRGCGRPVGGAPRPAHWSAVSDRGSARGAQALVRGASKSRATAPGWGWA